MQIGTIELTHDELRLATAIRWMQCDGAVRYWESDHNTDGHADYLNNKPLVPKLLSSLNDRNAIPAIRMKYFIDPAFAVGLHGKSHHQVFERNGSTGLDLIQHPHFLPFLWYFIHGARLPQDIKAEVFDLCTDSLVTIDDVTKTCRRLLRESIRSGRVTYRDYNVRDEFYKLILDCRNDATYAGIVRGHIGRVAREMRRY